jgi:hypothetical protein
MLSTPWHARVFEPVDSRASRMRLAVSAETIGAFVRSCLHRCEHESLFIVVWQPNDKRAGNLFGYSVAVDDDAGTIVIGAIEQVGLM